MQNVAHTVGQGSQVLAAPDQGNTRIGLVIWGFRTGFKSPQQAAKGHYVLGCFSHIFQLKIYESTDLSKVSFVFYEYEPYLNYWLQ
jgi:hypothetical protein